jgi:RNA polymerase sigma-70 factor, ECF subfamily
MDLPRTFSSTQASDVAREASQEAAQDFVQTYLAQVYRLALAILDDPAEADEATQDTFIAALKSREGYRGEASEKTWLFSIAINTCRRRLRKRKAREGLVQTLQSIFRVSGAGPTHPEETILRGEARTALWTAVNALGEKHRLPIVLYYQHELSVAEIAQALNLPTGTVLSRLHTARERLRAGLRDKQDLLSEADHHETD